MQYAQNGNSYFDSAELVDIIDLGTDWELHSRDADMVDKCDMQYNYIVCPPPKQQNQAALQRKLNKEETLHFHRYLIQLETDRFVKHMEKHPPDFSQSAPDHQAARFKQLSLMRCESLKHAAATFSTSYAFSYVLFVSHGMERVVIYPNITGQRDEGVHKNACLAMLRNNAVVATNFDLFAQCDARKRAEAIRRAHEAGRVVIIFDNVAGAGTRSPRNKKEVCDITSEALAMNIHDSQNVPTPPRMITMKNSKGTLIPS